jgi:S1-C subfamily serine protease
MKHALYGSIIITLLVGFFPQKGITKNSINVVQIETKSILFPPQGIPDQNLKPQTNYGSGFVFGKYVITNHHVMEGFVSYKVRNQNGTEISTKFVGGSYCDDVAVLKILGQTKPSPKWSGKFEKQTQVEMMGYSAQNSSLSKITGQITKVFDRITDNLLNDHDVMVVKPSLEFGFSGGPTTNSEGQIIGVNIARGENESYILPFYKVEQSIQKILKRQTLFTGSIGAYPIYSNQLQKYGMIVTSLTPNISKNTQLPQLGDLITQVDEEELTAINPNGNTWCRAVKNITTQMTISGFRAGTTKPFRYSLKKDKSN